MTTKKKFNVFLTISYVVPVKAKDRKAAEQMVLDMHTDELDNTASDIEWKINNIQEVF
jgi:hypothetical protein